MDRIEELYNSLVEYWSGLSDRERLTLTIGALAAVLIVGWWVSVQYRDFITSLETQRDDLIFELESSQRRLERVPQWTKEREQLEVDFISIDNQLMPAQTESGAGDELQQHLRQMANAANLNTAELRFDAQQSEEHNMFSEISWSLRFRTTPSRFRNFLYNIESARRQLMIRSLNINVNPREPGEWTVNMRVAGLFKPPPGADDETEEDG